MNAKALLQIASQQDFVYLLPVLVSFVILIGSKSYLQFYPPICTASNFKSIYL